MWHKYNPWRDDVLCTISKSIGQKVKVTRYVWIFAVWAVGILVDHWSTISSSSRYVNSVLTGTVWNIVCNSLKSVCDAIITMTS